MSAGSSEDEFPNGENTPVVKVEVPDGETDPKDLEGRDNVKTEPGLMAEHQGLPIEERPNVTTATSGLSNDPPLSPAAIPSLTRTRGACTGRASTTPTTTMRGPRTPAGPGESPASGLTSSPPVSRCP